MLRAYAEAGGKVYSSCWAYGWTETPFREGSFPSYENVIDYGGDLGEGAAYTTNGKIEDEQMRAWLEVVDPGDSVDSFPFTGAYPGDPTEQLALRFEDNTTGVDTVSPYTSYADNGGAAGGDSVCHECHEGTPNVSKLNKINIGADVESQHRNDQKSEQMAVKAYNEGIAMAAEAGDNGTRELLEGILKDEEDHLDTFSGWLEDL